MSSSSEFSSQKPSFSHKCSLLSQYLKENGSFGDLSLGMTCNAEPTTGARELSLMLPTAQPTTTTTMNLFPQQSGFVSTVPKMADSRANKPAVMEPKATQMTIFYGGKVIVFDDLPADKAKEVMLFASKGSSLTQNQNTFASNPVKIVADAPSPMPPTTPNVLPNFSTHLVQENAQQPSKPVVCDLPIARRASLHRFLEKRKDRITAKPYVSNSPAASTPVEPKPWLGLAGQSAKPFQC